MAIYSDLNQLTPTVSPLVMGVDAVYQSITNILSTPKKTRLFNFHFGADLEELLFEPMDEIITFKIFNLVIDVIQRWDNRVKISNSESYVSPVYAENKYDLVLVFNIKGYEDPFEYKGELVRP